MREEKGCRMEKMEARAKGRRRFLCFTPPVAESLCSVSDREGGRDGRRPTTIKTMTVVGRNEKRRGDR